MHEVIGRFATQNGSKYLQQLCKHFGHKIDVEYTETQGSCSFEMGKAFLTADQDGLTVRFELVTPDVADTARSVIDSHLIKFAFRENFEQMDWQG